MSCFDKVQGLLWKVLNPFTAPACKISGQKKLLTYTPSNSTFDGPITNLLLILCILMEVLSRARAKGWVGEGKPRLDNFKFGTFTGHF